MCTPILARVRRNWFPTSPGMQVYHMCRDTESSGELVSLLKKVGMDMDYKKRGMIMKRRDNCITRWQHEVRDIKACMERMEARMIEVETEAWITRQVVEEALTPQVTVIQHGQSATRS